MLSLVFAVAAGLFAAGVAVAVASAPDLARYRRLRRM